MVPGEREAEELVDDLALFTDALHLPAWETLPFEHVSPNVATMAARAEARHALGTTTWWPRCGPPCSGSVHLRWSRSSSSPATDIDLDVLVRRLSDAGYHRTDRVEARGEMAVRGGIVDVYPAQGAAPVRLDFWGDTVEEIRAFSVGTQRSVERRRRAWSPTRPGKSGPNQGIAGPGQGTDPLTEPWAMATWDRIADGVFFAGMESWLPWLSLRALGARRRRAGGAVRSGQGRRPCERSRQGGDRTGRGPGRHLGQGGRRPSTAVPPAGAARAGARSASSGGRSR